MDHSHNIRGAAYMVVAMVGFASNDAIIKLMSESMNVGQVMLVRGVFASAIILLLCWRTGAFSYIRMLSQPLVVLRAANEVAATVTFLLALAHMPIANVSAVLQALPLTVTMGAALAFGQSVGWRRWIAICAGFVGVLITIRPGAEGFNAYSLFALASVGFCTVRDLATSRLPDNIPTHLVSAATSLAVTLTGAVMLLPMGGWSEMAPASTALLALSAILLVFGYHFIILAMRTGEISFISPFRYTSLLASILLGIVMFAEIPDLAMTVGATIIVASGLYTLYRERAVGRYETAAASAGPSMGPDGI